MQPHIDYKLYMANVIKYGYMYLNLNKKIRKLKLKLQCVKLWQENKGLLKLFVTAATDKSAIKGTGT